MSTYNMVAEMNESTVVSKYVADYGKLMRSDAFQSEAALEKEFIRLLTTQGYEYLQIHDEKALIANLRKQLELLNNYSFSDKEWQRFFEGVIANKNEGIVEKTQKI